MVGVSTGSIIVSLLAFKKLAVADVESIYNEVGKQVFKQTYLGGITSIAKSYSYYDTASYQRILQVIPILKCVLRKDSIYFYWLYYNTFGW